MKPSRNLPSLFIALALLPSFAPAALNTTVLPDPWPNVAPFPVTRIFNVERDVARRTPSAILNVYDVENDALSVASFTQPAHGRAVANGDGTFTYTPAAGFTGADEFAVTVSDGRGGVSTTTMQARVSAQRAGVAAPRFTNFAPVQAAGVDIAAGSGRVAVALVDFDGDGVRDIAVCDGSKRTVTFYRTTTKSGATVLAAGVVAQTEAGAPFVADDVRIDVADWNGDGKPDIIIGTGSGEVKVAYGVVATATEVRFAALDAKGRTISGSYNLAPRVIDLTRDGVPDLLVGYNWGNIDFYTNTGTATAPVLAEKGTLAVTLTDGAGANLHALTDGLLADLADFNGDGVLDLVCGGNVGGKIYLATGVTPVTDLQAIVATVAAHPADLGTFLESDATAKAAMKNQLGRVYDFVTAQATPSQVDAALGTLESLITTYPQYFEAKTVDVAKNPGIPSLAAMLHLTMLMGKYHDTAHRARTANAARMTGAYRKLCEDTGLLYMENFRNPDGAEAIWQWVRWIPRDVYPGTGITQTESLGSRDYLVRGHLKNTFAGKATGGGEFGFHNDAKPVIGARGSENFLMTVVHHEATHDLDAYVNTLPPDFRRRWGQVLVRACGRDESGANFMKEDPATGWYSAKLTQAHWQAKGWWNGTDDWSKTLKDFFTTGLGKEWNTFGFMRGNPATFFLPAPQESLATQGNQFWNSGEGRIEVALDRWRRGYDTNLTEVLLFMDIQSKGANKMKLSENDDTNEQRIAWAKLTRNAHGYIDSVEVEGRVYRFVVDAAGVVTAVTAP